MMNTIVICSILISVITFQGIFTGSVSVEARYLADRSSSEYRICSLLGTADSCSKLFMETTTDNSGYATRSPPPPPKVAPTPHNSPASMKDLLFEKATPSTLCASSA
ncbi:hypothetical protein ABKV19_008694 [Rosa sericea]